MDIRIVDAKIGDADFIAKCVLAAIQKYDFVSCFDSDDPFNISILNKSRQPDTIFSYRNTRIAFCDGNPVGSIVSYPGTIYKEARRRTFESSLARESDMECNEDEYYLDSMAVIPQARHLGLGKLLMTDAIRRGMDKGFKKFSLIVLDRPDHEHLKGYYSSLGFQPLNDIAFLGEKYTRMVMDRIYKHYVMWKFMGDETQRTESALWMKEYLEALPGIIPGLLSAKVLLGTDKMQNYDALLESSFAGEESLSSYKVHPEHVKVSEYCKNARESRTSFDAWSEI